MSFHKNKNRVHPTGRTLPKTTDNRDVMHLLFILFVFRLFLKLRQIFVLRYAVCGHAQFFRP